jgi:hypothetical protein
VLRVTLWKKQVLALESLLEAPYRTLVLSGHNVGKTFVAAVAVNWWYDTRDPGIAITTARISRDVQDLVWKEIRLQRARAGLGSFGAHLQSSPDHYAKGFTAETGESFQGRHDVAMLFVFDEAIGIDSIFWETTKTMFKPDGQHAWLCIGNPTKTSSQAWQEDQSGRWNRIEMSALEHPNIVEELAGRPAPYPAALSLTQLDEGLRENCSPVAMGEQQATDVEWPPESGQWLRPGMIAEARWLGRWPSQDTDAVWSQALWEGTLRPLPEPTDVNHQIGCDVARKGDDWTSFHVRRGPVSVHHETYNKKDVMWTVGRLVQLARQYAALCSEEHPGRQPVKPEQIPIKLTTTGSAAGSWTGSANWASA